MSGVIAAIDLGPSSARVLHHGAGFARLLQENLQVLHVSADTSDAERDRVVEFCAGSGPYELDVDQVEVVVRTGRVSDAINREAARTHASLVVLGARGRSSVATLLLGSSSQAVLQGAASPVLLVPPNDLDIVNITDRVTLNTGPILAAVDLAEACDLQLSLASRLAQLSGQPLLLMTVAAARMTDHEAGVSLLARAHGLKPVRPHATIVRRGNIAEEIADCASMEGAGLVVMGLRSPPRGQPGVIASAVLRTKSAFVLAVPGC